MILLTDLDFSLPLKNPVIIFSLVLFIILFAPILLKKIKVPHIIGLILAGVIVGPYALNLLRRDSSIVLFGTVGLLYIMFLAGLEIDISEFKKNRKKIIFFGLITFMLPLICGTFASYYILGYGWLSSILLASMFSTHTLVSYPIASKYGVSRNRAVALTIGGTMITDILALLILAIIAGMTKGEVNSAFWVTLGVSTVIFVGVVFFIFPIIIRWFFKHYEDSVSQYIFVLAIVFLASFLAEAAGIEAIIGAFFAGLVLNNFIPHSSPLMNRISFVGNALFIPFFLIGVGMLVNFNVLFNGWGAIRVAGVIVAVAISTKFVAAWITQKSFRLFPEEGKMIFGLSTSHAAATLAIILVGYNIIIGETPEGDPIRLLDEDILNGTILLILISCAISSFVVEKASHNLALKEAEEASENEDNSEKILISLAYPDTVSELIDFGLMLKPKKSNIPVYVLNIISDETNNETGHFTGKKMMDNAVKQAAATEDKIIPLTRYDVNISNGIIYTIKEQNITDVLIGLHKDGDQNNFLGPVTENILSKSWETIFIYKPVQPFNTLKRMVVIITPNAELEPGFNHWFTRISTIAKAGGLPLHFFANDLTIEELKKFNSQSASPVVAAYTTFAHWEDFLIMSRELKQNDFFVIVSSRKGHISYNENLEKLPYYLAKYFTSNSFIIIYPKQFESDQTLNEKEHSDNFILEAIADKVQVVNKAGSYISRMFKKKK
ncbi:MAG TPA: cation:proton antiporter [Hanamia sp.]|nr:cation:proton antiporter [Hanamia sp.]